MRALFCFAGRSDLASGCGTQWSLGRDEEESAQASASGLEADASRFQAHEHRYV